MTLARSAAATGDGLVGRPNTAAEAKLPTDRKAILPPETQPWVVEPPRERRDRIRSLFRKLDQKGSGLLDTEAIRKGMDEMRGVHPSYASELVRVCDETEDGFVDFPEFERYIHSKEKELWHVFKEIDESGDGNLQPEELRRSLRSVGIKVCNEELDNFVRHMDSKNDGLIDYTEWRDSLLLLPTRNANLQNIYHFYRKSVSQLDFEGNVNIPRMKDISAVRNTGFFVAGGLAGAISRTCTAPLDRVKVYLITHVSEGNTSGPLKVAKALVAARAVEQQNLQLRSQVVGGRVVDAVRHLYAAGGIRTFFRGNGINIIKIAPESAIKFWSYETGKTFLASLTTGGAHHKKSGLSASTGASRRADSHAIGMSGRFVAGGIAGMLSQMFIYPLETVKTRIMTATQEGAASPPGQKTTTERVAPSDALGVKSGSPRPRTPALLSSSSRLSYPLRQTISLASSFTVSSSLHPPRPTVCLHSADFTFSTVLRQRYPYSYYRPLFSKYNTALIMPSSKEINRCKAPAFVDRARNLNCVTPRSSSTSAATAIIRGSMERSLIVNTVRQMWSEAGIRAFYRGLTPAMLGVFPYAAIDMSGRQEPSALVLLGCGAVSGTVGASSVYPLNYIRTRLQAQGSISHATQYIGSMDVIRTTYAKEGIHGFYKGLAPTLLKGNDGEAGNSIVHPWTQAQIKLTGSSSRVDWLRDL